MKKYLVLLTLIVCALATTRGYADSCYSADCCETACCNEGRLYAGLFGGANWLRFKKVDGVHSHFKVGYAGALALGYQFNSCFRLEGEAAYRRNNFSHAKANGIRLHGKGHAETLSFMANGYLDFDTSTFCCVRPYVGVGAGYAHIKARLASDYYTSDYESSGESVKGHNRGFCYQAIAGVATTICDCTDLALEYRFFSARKHANDHSVGLTLRRFF